MDDTNRLLSNAGRCDICGRTIDMRDAGDTLAMSEFQLPDEIKERYDLTDQDAADEVADALERVGESGADYELAAVIREKRSFRVHEECLTDTNYYLLTDAEGVERID